MATGRTGRIHTKNLKTGKLEIIKQIDISIEDWGIQFFCDSELDAYKAVYEYRYNKHGVDILYVASTQKWMVTIFNSLAVEAGISGAK